MAKPVNEFLDEMYQEFQPLFEIAKMQARMFFSQEDLNKDKLANFFKNRMFNERWNMVEIAKKVSELPVDTPAEEAKLLAKQAFDEAEHFRLVCEVIEHVTGDPVTPERLREYEKTHGSLRPGYGAMLVQKYEAHGDPLLMAIYQYLVEGQGAHVWSTMAECAVDEYVKKRYAKIAKDEHFHANIGRMKLEKLCQTEEDQKRAREVARIIYWDLYECHSIASFPPNDEIKRIMREAYGDPPRELCVPI